MESESGKKQRQTDKVDCARDVLKMMDQINGIIGTFFPRKELEKPSVVIREIRDSMQGSRAFIRVAGASGAIAVMMSAYGAHGE